MEAEGAPDGHSYFPFWDPSGYLVSLSYSFILLLEEATSLKFSEEKKVLIISMGRSLEARAAPSNPTVLSSHCFLLLA